MKKLIILGLVLSLFFINGLIERTYEYDRKTVVSFNENSEELNENGFLIGNLRFLNSDYDFKVVQTDNNEFFLSHDEDGNSSIKGSVFLDYRNDVWDQKLIIYGHNSERLSDVPFHFLENYLDECYTRRHEFLSFEGKDFSFLYELFTVMIVTDDFRHVNLKFDETSYYQHLLWLQSQSKVLIPLTLEKNDSILLLQTCYYDPKPSYLVIGFKKK